MKKKLYKTPLVRTEPILVPTLFATHDCPPDTQPVEPSGCEPITDPP